jgi:dephospho-CoA kinase
MIIGLTGSIGTGKSESAKYFEALGVCSIDADLISRYFTNRGMPALNVLVKNFGQDILHSGGILNRKKLADIIFSNKQAKLMVEKILHVYIVTCINKIISYKIKNKRIIIINAPLLFETGLDVICDRIVTIWLPHDVQMKRLILRDQLDIDVIKKRIDSQMSIEKKIKLSDFIIDNTGSKKDLKNDICDLYKLLTSELK